MREQSPVFYRPERIGDFGLIKMPFLYGIIAMLWLMVSQRLIDIAVQDGPLNRTLQTFDGVGFVLVTTIGLGILLARLQRRIRDGELRLEAVLENSPDGIAVVRQGTCVLCNPALCRMLGCESADQIAGRNILDFIAPEQRERLRSAYRRRLQAGHATLQLDTVGVRADGSRFDLRIRAGMFQAAGKHHVAAVLSDITAERDEHARLEAECATLAAAVDQVPEGVIACNAEGRLTLLNQRARMLLGLPDNAVASDCEALDLEFVDADSGHSLGGVSRLLHQLLQGRRIDDRPLRISPHGAETVLAHGTRMLDDSGRPVGGALVLQDVSRALSRRRRQRQRLQLLDSVSRIKSVLLEDVPGEEMVRRLTPLLAMLDPEVVWVGIMLLSASGNTGSLHHFRVGQDHEPDIIRFSATALSRGRVGESIGQYSPDALSPLDRTAPVRDIIEQARIDNYLHIPLRARSATVGAVNLGRRAPGDPDPATTAALLELQPLLARRLRAASARPAPWRDPS